MKEAYFTPDNITELGRAWLERYGSNRKAKSQPFDINQAGLLILDMQNYFLESRSHAFVPSGEVIIPGLNNLSDLFRSAGRPVIATRHENQTGKAGMMETWWSELLTRDHPLVDLHDDLSVSSQEIITKTQYDAFYDSNLLAVLEKNHVTQLVIGGVMTHLCCETTARSGFVHGYEVFFLIDGTATYHRGHHKATLKNLAHGVAVLTTIRHLLAKE